MKDRNRKAMFAGSRYTSVNSSKVIPEQVKQQMRLDRIKNIERSGQHSTESGYPVKESKCSHCGLSSYSKKCIHCKKLKWKGRFAPESLAWRGF